MLHANDKVLTGTRKSVVPCDEFHKPRGGSAQRAQHFGRGEPTECSVTSPRTPRE